jgi:outer membrane lipoprotein-sorting protein/peroxiredoxin
MRTAVLALLGAVALPAPFANAQSTTVAQVLNRLSNRYRGANSLHYVGKWTQKLGSKERSATIEFGMQRPARFALEMAGDKLNTVLVCDGSFVTTLRPDRNVYTRVKAPARLLGADLLGKTDLTLPGASVVALLLEGQLRDPSNKLARALNAATLREPVGDGASAADVLSFRPDDVTEWRIYVSQRDGLIRAASTYSGGKVEITETYSTVEVDQPLPAGFFDRKLPESARLVSVLPALEKPEVEIEFTVKSITGAQISLADLKGKVVLLNFFFTTCPPCQAEFPHLVDLYNRLHAKGLEVLAVNGVGEKVEEIDQFGKDFEAPFPLCQNSPTDVVRLFGITAYPTNLIFNREGKLVKRLVGFEEGATAEELAGALKGLGIE